MNLNVQPVESREYQVRLDPELFVRGDADVFQFLTYAARADPWVRLSTKKLRHTTFARELLDTEDRDFASHGFKLRVRTFAEHLACTFKLVDLDRYVVSAAEISSTDENARRKFEEGIYAFHTGFSKQVTSRQPLGTKFSRVADWGRVFPDAFRIAHPDQKLVAHVHGDVQRIHRLRLQFADVRVAAMLELCYADLAGTPIKVDFSWKYRQKRERYDPRVSRQMRAFMQGLNQSSWAVPREHLEKARTDAVLTERPPPPAERSMIQSLGPDDDDEKSEPIAVRR